MLIQKNIYGVNLRAGARPITWCNALPRDPLPARASRQFDLEASRHGWTKSGSSWIGQCRRRIGSTTEIKTYGCVGTVCDLMHDGKSCMVAASRIGVEAPQLLQCSILRLRPCCTEDVSTNCENRSNYLSKSDCANNLWM